MRAADEAALHRVARRRARQDVQRKERVDVRYSVDEKQAICAEASRRGPLNGRGSQRRSVSERRPSSEIN
ncbi:hypothetical protein [Streptomyces narbonensis]